MVDLYRFVPAKYLESFLDGELYMNSLGFFWEKGFEKQRDFFEGTSRMIDPDIIGFGDDLKSHISGSVLYRLRSYQFCNVLCFYKHYYDPKNKKVTPFDVRMKNFGDYIVRILDAEVLIERIITHARMNDYDFFLAGPVHYHKRGEKNKKLDSFDNMEEFAYQKEWRISYLSDFKKKKEIAKDYHYQNYKTPLTINIGDIRSITEVYKTKDVIASPLNIYRGYRIVDNIGVSPDLDILSHAKRPWVGNKSAAEYYGWGNREALQNKFIEIDGAVNMMFSTK